jgi:hypothetical protein
LVLLSPVSEDLIALAASKGRTLWLQQLLRERLPELNADNPNYHDWFEGLIAVMESRGLVEPTQQKDYLSDVRGAIKVIDPDHPALEVVDFDKATWTAINNRSGDRLATRTTKLISDPDALVKRATVLLGSYQWSEIAAGLAVVTGRRCTEVIQTAQFEYKTKYSVIFTGSLKRRNEPVECVFEIPTLCEARLVMGAIASLRYQLGEVLHGLSPRQVSSRYGSAVATKCDRFFSDLVPKRDDRDNLYTHLFRAVYATIASYWFCPPTVPEMEFRAAIQGHYQILDEQNPELRRSLAAGRNYFDYKIGDGQGNIDGRLGIKLELPDVDVVEQFQQAYLPQYPPWHGGRSQTTTTNKTLSKRSKSKSAMTEPSHSSHNSAVTIPSFFLSRLEAISHRLGLNQSETIQALFTWTEMGLSLARSLELDELNPQAVFESVERLKPTPSTVAIATIDPDVSRERALYQLCNSVELLSRAIAEINLADVNSNTELDKTLVELKSPKPSQSSVETLNNTKTEAKSSSSNSSKGKRSSQRTLESERQINHAIDLVMEFNNAEGRAHLDKWYIGIGSIRTLTGRGDKVIRRVLQQRQDVEQHHHQHRLDSSHNLKGQNALTINDVISLD